MVESDSSFTYSFSWRLLFNSQDLPVELVLDAWILGQQEAAGGEGGADVVEPGSEEDDALRDDGLVGQVSPLLATLLGQGFLELGLL